ncbi:MAG: hypothetical protein BWK76_08995 [Desulfobulbaceae bacterium A2]|nr:MAG: hypothetical protein BWK76_08995 [Desulfobulbaceae bacterium A2]
MANGLFVKKASNVFIVFMFIVFIFSSFLGMLASDKVVWSEAEKRSLSLFPPLPTSPGQIVIFFTALDKYLEDHFGFREFYIRRYQRELDKRFNITISSSRVIKGLGGWYFFNDFNMYKDFLGLIPLKSEQLKTWLARQEEKQTWLQERGIRYIYMAIPNKQVVYPQFLMEHAMARKGTTRFEQLRKYTGNHLPDYMIDLHQLLRPETFAKPLYYKNDSHWNKFGAYITFREIMRRVATWFPDQEFFTEFEFGPDIIGIGGNIGFGGDLTMMLMQPELTETYPQEKKFMRCGPYVDIPFPLSDIIVDECRNSFMKTCKKRKLRAVVFRDSFFVSLEPFLSENFYEIIYLWKEYSQQNLEEIFVHFKPDIVIEAIVERHVFDSLLALEEKNRP